MTTTTMDARPTTADERLEAMAAQLDELTAEIRAQRAQREQLAELLGDLSHVSGGAMQSLTSRLESDEASRYLGFARSGMGVVDRIVGNFDEDDVAALGENVVLILETVKEMTQPEIMTMLQRTAHLMNEAPDTPAEPPSLLHLVRDMRDPQVRRGVVRLLVLLRSLGANEDGDT